MQSCMCGRSAHATPSMKAAPAVGGTPTSACHEPLSASPAVDASLLGSNEEVIARFTRALVELGHAARR